MLQNIRDRLHGPFVWFIVGIIVIPFAFFGIETFRTGGGDPTLVKVGDEKITESEFRRGYDQRLRQLQNLMGDSFRADLIDQPRFRQTVLDDLVQEELLRQHVRDAGYRAGNASVFEALTAIPAFQEDGKFSTEAYRSRLSQQGYAPAAFEEQLRDALEVDQMREGVLASAFVPPTAAAQSYRLAQQQRWLGYAVFPAARYADKVPVGDEQVRERYEQQKARYQSPERLKVAYVELALEELPPAAAPEADYLRSIYEAEKATRYSSPEERKARHLLISFGADKGAAKQRIESIAEQIARGADFASLAGSQSEDPGSKKAGGDLGWIKRGQMVESFEKAAFALGKGEVSAPVETEFGWHLVKIDDIRPARTRPFDDPQVQAELLEVYRTRDAERRFQELSDKLEQAAFESPASLEPAAKAAGVPVKTSDWFSRTAGTGIAAQPAVREAAFADDVLQAGENSRPLSSGPNRIVVLRKQEYEAPRQRPLEEVAAAIREELKQEGARARAAADAAAMLDALAKGARLEQAALERKAEFKAPGLVKRDAQGIDAKIIDALFQLPRPADGGTSREQVTLANGDVAVVVTTAVQDADWTAAPDDVRRAELARQREATAGAEFAAYRADLEKRLEVEVIAAPSTDQPAS